MKPDPLREFWKKNTQYAFEAFQFLFEALEHTARGTGAVSQEGQSRHVSGQQLLDGMRSYALSLYGPLAADVWRAWGVHSTLDWGKVVFQLVDGGMLNRQDSDTLDDFENGYDFDEVFGKAYRPVLPAAIPLGKVTGEE